MEKKSKKQKWEYGLSTQRRDAIKRVLELVDGYLSVQDQDVLQAYDGGMMTWGELRRHIKGAIYLLPVRKRKVKKLNEQNR